MTYHKAVVGISLVKTWLGQHFTNSLPCRNWSDDGKKCDTGKQVQFVLIKKFVPNFFLEVSLITTRAIFFFSFIT